MQLKDANTSRFAQLFAKGKGLDPYAAAASDIYQDLFGEGSFTGKGIYDVRDFETALEFAFGENRILSHDLIEGCHARVGLVSDIKVVDGFPSRYDAEHRRQHRWTRGDWQIMPWLFGYVPCASGKRPNRLSLLSRWKIFDNLRRSLVAPALCVMLLAAWFLAPEIAAIWSLIAWLTVGWPVVAAAIEAVVRWPRRQFLRSHLYSAAIDLIRAMGQAGVQAACLPHKAWMMADAIVRTLVRLGVTRKKMLEWETAAATEHRLSRGKSSIVGQMAFVPVAAAVTALLLPSAARPSAAPWLAAWALSPWIAHFISLPFATKRKELTAADQQWLRLTARHTWSYFETYVGPRTNWLPPDNFQEFSDEKLAERISPTNEGLFLVSALIARDFGYLGLHALTDLWEKNLSVWRNLPQHQGHFYNWYDTATLTPLIPRYVSTVDSGNLAASLLVVQQGIDDVRRSPVFGAHVWEGLRDTIAAAIDSCERLQPRGARIVSPPLDELTSTLNAVQAAVRSAPQGWDELHSTVARLRENRQEIADRLDRFLASHRHPSTEVARTIGNLLSWIDGVTVDAVSLAPWCEEFAALSRLESNDIAGSGNKIREKLEAARSLDDLAQLDDCVLTLLTLERNGDGDADRITRFRELLQRGAEAAQKTATPPRRYRPAGGAGCAGDEFRVSLQFPAPAVRDRLQSRRRPPGPLALRHALLGSEAEQPPGHCQRRRRLQALVSSGAAVDVHRRPAGTLVVGRHDVRVPDAAVVSALLSRIFALAGMRSRRRPPAGVWPPAQRAVGNLRIGVRHVGGEFRLLLSIVRRAGTGAETGFERGSRHCALCHHVGAAAGPAYFLAEFASFGERRRARQPGLLRRSRLHAAARAAGSELCSCAVLHGSSPGDEPDGDREPASGIVRGAPVPSSSADPRY